MAGKVKLVKLDTDDIEFLINVIEDKKNSTNNKDNDYDECVVLIHIFKSYLD